MERAAKSGRRAFVLHVYDRLDLYTIPLHYTIAAGQSLKDQWTLRSNRYDQWLLGPNGFHRQFSGSKAAPLRVTAQQLSEPISLLLTLADER